jgi:adenylate cyclase
MEQSSKRLITSACVLVVCLILFSLGFFSQFNHKLGDTLYHEHSALGNIVIIGIDDASLQQVGRWPWGRGNFSLLLNKLPEASVVGIDVAFLEPSDTAGDAALAAAITDKVVLASEYTSFSQGRGVVQGQDLLKPVVNSSTGYVNIVTDSDGVARSLQLALGDEPAFTAEMYRKYTGKEIRAERFLINYAGPPGSYTQFSAGDVIAGKIPSSEFKGKIVLIGAIAPDFHDDALVPTSNGRLMPGVEIHANALQTMLLDNELHKAPDWITALLIVLCVVLVTLFIFRFSAIIAFLLCLALIVVYIAFAFLMFRYEWVMNLVYIPFVTLATFTLLMIVDVVYERFTKRKVMTAFGKYVSHDILDQIMKKDIVLGGEKRELTILFSDIRGFTGISEKLSPEELVDFLNTYFTRVTRVIMGQKGLVDKFIGDAIMAFWNAPLLDQDHAEHAVYAALAMKEELEHVRKEHEGKYPRMDIGIGINTGEAVVGNVGSNERLSYTAIGDSVNLASRLEGLTKYYGVAILISESTRKRLKKDVTVRELDLVKVKGKKEPVRVYEVVGLQVDDLDIIKRYESSLHLYYKGKWREAAKGFSALEDEASKIMLARCNEFVADPPAAWDGSHEMTHK